MTLASLGCDRWLKAGLQAELISCSIALKINKYVVVGVVVVVNSAFP